MRRVTGKLYWNTIKDTQLSYLNTIKDNLINIRQSSSILPTTKQRILSIWEAFIIFCLIDLLWRKQVKMRFFHQYLQSLQYIQWVGPIWFVWSAMDGASEWGSRLFLADCCIIHQTFWLFSQRQNYWQNKKKPTLESSARPENIPWDLLQTLFSVTINKKVASYTVYMVLLLSCSSNKTPHRLISPVLCPLSSLQIELSFTDHVCVSTVNVL